MVTAEAARFPHPLKSQAGGLGHWPPQRPHLWSWKCQRLKCRDTVAGATGWEGGSWGRRAAGAVLGALSSLGAPPREDGGKGLGRGGLCTARNGLTESTTAEGVSTNSHLLVSPSRSAAVSTRTWDRGTQQHVVTEGCPGPGGARTSSGHRQLPCSQTAARFRQSGQSTCPPWCCVPQPACL